LELISITTFVFFQLAADIKKNGAQIFSSYSRLIINAIEITGGIITGIFLFPDFLLFGKEVTRMVCVKHH